MKTSPELIQFRDIFQFHKDISISRKYSYRNLRNSHKTNQYLKVRETVGEFSSDGEKAKEEEDKEGGR